MEIYEVVKKLIGSIEPYGDSSIDEKRNSNLDEHIKFTHSLIEGLVEVAKYKNRHEYSIKNLGINAHDGLLEITEIIRDYL